MVTSEALGPMMGLNPVVLRRTLAGLRDAGIVRSEKGHGGGWVLGRGLDQVTLEQAVNRALERTLDDAEARILSQLRSISVTDIERELGGNISQRHTKGSRTCTT